MHGWRWVVTFVAILGFPSIGWSLIVNPARPITHQVNVRLIETALSDGTSPVTMLGDPFQRAEIEANVDQIWSQAGIDVNFLPTVIRYNDSFALRGNVDPGGVRPVGDLTQILKGAASAGGILHPNSAVINLVMVDVVPGFSARGESWAGGLGHVGLNGIAMNVGENLLASPGGRQSVAALLAHEIGHNLGLRHYHSETTNLMSTKRGTAQLTDEQIDSIFQWHFRNDEIAYIPQGGTGFPQPIPSLAGDFTRDGVVDSADYSLWRDSIGTANKGARGIAADGNGDSRVDLADYAIWKANFGRTIVPADLPGDYNRDGFVDAADYSLWRETLGSITDLAADGNKDLIVNDADYSVWKSNFGSALMPQVRPGDYNRDGVVNAADYSIWRDSRGSRTNLAADGNGNGIIDNADYAIWKRGFSGVFASSAGETNLGHLVPEPTTLLHGMLALGAAATLRRRARRGIRWHSSA